MKIGLIAMSGLRAHDPELLRLGMTLPGVVERQRVVSSLPSLGLLYLAAVTPPTHQVRYFEIADHRQPPPEILQCDLVAISTLTAQARDAYALSDRLRSAGVRVVLGGLHASTLPEEAMEHADDVVVGEGENVWPEVVCAAQSGSEGRIWRASQFPSVQISHLPIPRYDLLAGRPYRRYTVQTSRGCPWRCDFCASNVMLRQAYRKRPVADVVRDIHVLKRLYERPFVELADDNTFVDKVWGKQLCRALLPLGVSWFTETDISVADDPELLDLMRQSGCRQVLIGLESPEPVGLRGVETKTDFKARRWATAADAVRRIQQHGITVNGCFILGLDGHTRDIFEQVLEFANHVALYDVQLTVLTPFPGTPLYRRLQSEGRLLYPESWDRCTLFDVNFVPRGMSVEQLRSGIYWLAAQLFTESSMKARRRVFHENLWRTRSAPIRRAKSA